jgi:hypothetical protein
MTKARHKNITEQLAKVSVRPHKILDPNQNYPANGRMQFQPGAITATGVTASWLIPPFPCPSLLLLSCHCLTSENKPGITAKVKTVEKMLINCAVPGDTHSTHKG